MQDLQSLLSSTLTPNLFTTLYPHSTISIFLSVLSSDGSLLACLLNAATLALMDAGIPMRDYICACTSGLTPSSPRDGSCDPLLDLNSGEEGELPFLTVATKGEGVCMCVFEGRVGGDRVEGMLATGVSSCERVRGILDGVVRAHGRGVVAGRVG